MFFNPAPLGFWSFATLCGCLRGPRVAVVRLIHALMEWEKIHSPRPGPTYLPGNGQLLLDSGGGGQTLHFRVQLGVTRAADPSDDQLQLAHQLRVSFAEFIAPRLEWSAQLCAPEGAFMLTGTPAVEPGELVSEQLLRVDGILDPTTTLRAYPAVKFYREAEGNLIALNTWALVSSPDAQATEEQLCRFGSEFARIGNYRALVIDRQGSDDFTLEEGCYWQDRIA